MTEADKDALLVRAALDIMTFQTRIAVMEVEMRRALRVRRALERIAAQAHFAPLPKAPRLSGAWRPGRAPTLREVMVEHVTEVYEAANWSGQRAAKILGVTPNTLYSYLPASVKARGKEMRRGRVQRIP